MTTEHIPVDAIPGNTVPMPSPYPQKQSVDYFAAPDTVTHYLPDGVQWVEIQVFNEGMKKKYQKITSRDIRMNQRTSEAIVKSTMAEDRHLLIGQAICGWEILRAGERLPYTQKNLLAFLEAAPPAVIDNIEVAIRRANPWLLGEMKAEDIRKEIADLEEMLKIAIDREEQEKG